MKTEITTKWEFLKWLLSVLFSPKTPSGRVILFFIFIMFCISAGIYYKLQDDKIEYKSVQSESGVLIDQNGDTIKVVN